VAAAAARSGRRSGRRRRHRYLRTPSGLTGSYETGGKAGECLENPGREVFFGVGARGSLPIRRRQIAYCYGGTGAEDAPEPRAPARFDGELRKEISLDEEQGGAAT
jgi:hypothetical protein